MAKKILEVGEFTIGRRIGTGARTTIYLATDQKNSAQIALKRVVIEKPEDMRIVEQMETEYRTSRRIDHPYIRKCNKLKKIRGAFKLKEVLLSMEYFDGESLEDGPALSLVDVLLVFRMVAHGLNSMHQAGYVHCDIKPNNILFSKSGSIRIIDLGQSCRIGTTKQRIQGTPDYIAPEQVKRRPLGARTDIFNLGATMYWALTGHHVPTLIPKKGADLSFLKAPACRPPHAMRRQVPVEVSALVMDCVRNEPVERPLNMMAVISRLDVIIHSILGGRLRKNRNG
jgi:serine/threonine-protein kinase